MKTLCLFLAGMILACSNIAQNITNYQFAATSGTFIPLAGSTTMALSGGNTDDGWFNGIPVGFTFYYMGSPYTTISASTKGWITFGQNISNAAYNNLLASGGTRPVVAPLWDDNDIQSNTNFSYLTTGTSPNRIFTAEWLNVKWKNTAVAGGISFQVKLYEANGKFEFIYRPEAGALVSPSASIGITATATGSGNYLSLNNATASPSASSTSETATISLKPADGQVYAFVPASTPAPPTLLNFTDVTKTSMTINWTDNSTTESWFVIWFSQDGSNFSQMGTVASTTISGTGTSYSISKTGLLPGITYYYRVAAHTEGNPPSSFLSGSQATLPPTEIVSMGTGNWTTPSTWSSGAVPSSLDNVTIANTHTVTIDGVADCNALTVGQGSSGILRFGTTATTMTTIQGVTVATGAIFEAGAPAGGNLTHNLKIGGTTATAMGTGSLAVNGTFDMHIGASNGKCTVTFFGIPDASVSGAGTIDFYRVTMNKGAVTATETSIPPILEILTPCSCLGSATTGYVYTHTSGTVKIGGSFTQSNPVYFSSGYNIPLTGGLWLNNQYFTMTGQNGSPNNNGLMKISAGICNIGTTINNAMAANANAVFQIENGTVNIAGRLNTANQVTYIQSGGTVNVTTVGNSTSNSPGFGLTHIGSTFKMSGGIICLQFANTNTTAVNRIDFNNNSSINDITGGLLQMGNNNSGTAKTYIIRGTAPNVTLTNTSANHSCNLSGNLVVKGDLTLNGSGIFSNNSNSIVMAGMSGSNPGNITVNTGAVLTLNTSSSAMLSFTSAFANQSLTNSGTITASQLAGLTINNTYGGTVTIPGGLTMLGDATLDLAKGALTISGGITLGTGSATGFNYIQGDGILSGTFARNYGTGTVNYTYNGTTSQQTSTELPSSISGTLTISNPAGVTLASPLSTGKFTLSAGTLNTTVTNLLTITGTSATDLTYTAGEVSGPMQRTLPASLVTGSNYLFPLGKSPYRPVKLVNPLTNAGGTVVIMAEVFNSGSGGTPGSTMMTLNNNRYWQVSIVSGGDNFTSSSLELNEDGLSANSGIANASDLAGIYDLVSVTAPTGNTLATATMNSLGYFVTGDKRMNYVSSITTQANTTNVREGSQNEVIIGVQVVASGTLDPALLTSLTLNINGTTRPADIAAAKVYFTGTNPTYAATGQFGTGVANPSGSFSVTGSQALSDGINYFWLAFDVAMGVVDNDLLDAECTSVTVRGVAYSPDVQAPTGNRTVKAALTGTITVGATGTYPTLTGSGGLFEKIALVGLKGNTFAQIVSDITEPGTNAITQWYEAGGSGFYLTISPDMAVNRTISGSYAGGLIRLNKAARVTIDGRYNASGKYLAITNTAASGSTAAIQLIGTAAGQGCSTILLRNCRIITGHNGSTSYAIAIGGATPGSEGYDHDQVTIQACNIFKATYGIYAGGNASGSNNNLVITGDSIGSYLAGNEVSRYGIYLIQCPDAMVSGNTIYNIFNASSDPRGIMIGPGSINSTVSGNLVTGVKNTGTSSNGAAGIAISPGYVTANISIVNNIVTGISATGSSNLAASAIAGIRIDNGTGFQVYYNSVNLTGNVSHSATGDVSAAIYFYCQGGVVLKNNILRNSIENTSQAAYAYAIYSDMARTGFSSIDYNDYFAAGSQGRTGFCAYSIASNITQWRTISLQDVHSIGDDPMVTGPYDLHLDFSSPARFTAIPIAGITTDFENVARHATTPTMGALETAVDNLGPMISFTPLIKTSSLSQRTLVATITDMTGVPVTGPGLPVLYWNINRGTCNPATGSHIGGSQYQFIFGSGVSPNDSVFYFIAAQDTWSNPNVSTQPSTGSAGFSINPPACSTKPANPEVYRIATTLSGNLTVGNNGQYASLTGTGGLFHSINSNILTGNIIVTVTSDLSEPGTYSLLAWMEEGTGNYKVTISPDGVIERLISGSVTQGMIRIDGADRVIIDGRSSGSGRYLRFRNTNTASSATIHLLNGATGDTIQNCFIEGSSTLSTSGTILFGTSTAATGNINNAILNNVIRDRSDGAGIPIICVNSGGTSSKVNAFNTISGNEIFNFINYGILVGNTGNGGSWNITGNSFFNNLATPPSTMQRAISVIPGVNAGNNQISGNFIGGHAAMCAGSAWVNTGTSSFYGILLGGSGSEFSVISNNVIKNISLTNNNTGDLIGIYLSVGSANITGNLIGDPVIANSLSSASQNFSKKLEGIRIMSETFFNNVESNTITNLVLTGVSGYVEATGIYVNAADLISNKITGVGHAINSTLSPTVNGIYMYGLQYAINDVINNMIAISGGASADPEIYGFFDNSYAANSYTFYHNSISIYGPANTSTSTCAFYRGSDASYELRNNVVANFRNSVNGGGVNYAIYLESIGNISSDYNDLYCPNGNTGYYNYADVLTLEDWRIATLQDLHSISNDPLFLNNASDLHPGPGSPMANAGAGLPDVTTDLDGNPRNPVTPTIGCYEVAMTFDKTWNGSTSESWDFPSNWTPAGVPLSSENLLIPSSTPFTCTVNTPGMLGKNITIASGAILNLVLPNSLTVHGNLTIQNGGTLNNSGLLILKGNLVNLNTSK